MVRRIDWKSVLNECKDRVFEDIAPLLKTVDQQQPDMDIGAGGDPITRIDCAAENAVVQTLTEHDVPFTLISEESGFKEYGDSPQETYVTTDPIDGTTNLTRGLPFYATSIAVSEKPFLSSVHSALVADLFHQTFYTAQKKRGAQRNGRRIEPSKGCPIEEAVIGIDLNGYRVPEIAPRLTSLIQKTKHIRHFGANALEICYVADGSTDAFIDIRGKLRTTDMAAAWLIINEAGGRITTENDEPLEARLDPKQRVKFVASANEKMHRIILESLKAKKEMK